MARRVSRAPLVETEAGTSSSPSAFKRIDELDKQLSLRVHGGCLKVPRRILKYLEYSGDGLLSIPLTAAIWSGPILLDKLELRSFLFNLFIALMFDLVVIGIVKGIIRRPRPVYNKGMYLVFSVDHYSFPSGHSSRALLLATFFWLYRPMWKGLLESQAFYWEDIMQRVGFGRTGFLPPVETCIAIVVLVWGLATAISRILLGRHHLLDVVAGCLLGVFEAWFVHEVLFVPSDISQGIHRSLMGIFKRTGNFS